MTMVNTFMKTQHQHVMPQRERKGKRSKQNPGLTLASEGEQRGTGRGQLALPRAQHPLPPVRAAPPTPRPGAERPPPREGDHGVCEIARRRAFLLERASPSPHPREKDHASVIPDAYVHLGQRTCSHAVENRDKDKTWLESDGRAGAPRGRARTGTRTQQCWGGDAAHHGQYGIIIYSKNGHVPRLDLLCFLFCHLQ